MPDVESDGAPHSAEQLNFARGKSAKAGSVISGFVIPEARIHCAYANEPTRQHPVGSAHPKTRILGSTVEQEPRNHISVADTPQIFYRILDESLTFPLIVDPAEDLGMHGLRHAVVKISAELL